LLQVLYHKNPSKHYMRLHFFVFVLCYDASYLDTYRAYSTKKMISYYGFCTIARKNINWLALISARLERFMARVNMLMLCAGSAQ
jgi:hypothetical protein